LQAALDRCAESSKHDPVSSDYHVTYHFDLIKTLPDLDSKTPPPPAPSDEEVPANVQLATVPMSILLVGSRQGSDVTANNSCCIFTNKEFVG